MTCPAILENLDSGVSISVEVIVDSGCQFPLTLDDDDILTLGLGLSTATGRTTLPDGSIAPLQYYRAVQLTLTLNDGSIAQAILNPLVITKDETEDAIGVNAHERLIGFPSMDMLGLKLDFRNKKLVRRTIPLRA